MFDESQYVVENVRSNDIVLHGSRLDNIYAINLYQISSMHLSCVKASLDDACIWHHRLGHASMHTLHELVTYDLVRRLPPYKFEKDCKYVLPLNTWKVLGIVVYCGPTGIRSLGGSSYVFVIVGDHYRFTWLNILKDQIEALEEFVKLCRKL